MYGVLKRKLFTSRGGICRVYTNPKRLYESFQIRKIFKLALMEIVFFPLYDQSSGDGTVPFFIDTWNPSIGILIRKKYDFRFKLGSFQKRDEFLLELAFEVEADQHDLYVLTGIALVILLKKGQFLDAGFAPSCPEFDNQRGVASLADARFQLRETVKDSEDWTVLRVDPGAKTPTKR